MELEAGEPNFCERQGGATAPQRHHLSGQSVGEARAAKWRSWQRQRQQRAGSSGHWD